MGYILCMCVLFVSKDVIICDVCLCVWRREGECKERETVCMCEKELLYMYVRVCVCACVRV